MSGDVAYQNAKENTPHTARMAHDQALGRAMQILLKGDTQKLRDGTELYKLYFENESFNRQLGDMVFAMTSQSQQLPKSP